MAEENRRPIVVKKIKKVAGGHHGGAWKIAYADFVTAMMAFFLLMWLLGSTAKGDLKGIAEYFKTPLKVALFGGEGSGTATSIIKGGGKDLTRKDGQVNNSDAPEKYKKLEMDKKDPSKSSKEAAKEAVKAEAAKLEELKKKIIQAISDSPALNKFKQQLLLDITSEGLRIQIVDEKNRAMFNSSKAELQPYAKEILHEIGKMLNDVPNRISLSGHTDAVPYPNGDMGYSNWELSSDRANASRRELVAGGMDESKLLRVVGLASASLFDKDNPLDPSNRRISIVVMNKKAEVNAFKDDSIMHIPSDASQSELDATDLTP